MFKFIRQRIGWKLFLSHISVTIISLVVLIIAAQFVSPASFNQYMMSEEMQSNMGSMMGEMGMSNMMADQEQLYQDFNAAIQNLITLTGIAAFAAAVIASLLVTRQMSKPVQELNTASQKIAEGNYQERVNIPGKANQRDEIGSLAANFNQMAGQLEKTETMRRQLIGDVAHELRTPLASIKGSMEGLIDEVLSPSPETYQKIYQEANRMQRIIDDLQNLSRVESGNYELDIAQIQIAPVIESAIRTLQSQYEDKNVSLESQIETNLPNTTADPVRIQQVLINLIGNALQYTPEGGHVLVSAVHEGSEILVKVRDDGIGLTPEDLELIFNRFYRVDKSRSRAGGGSGIGLTISKHLVEAHGGKIWAESDGEGQGSAFIFTLPVR